VFAVFLGSIFCIFIVDDGNDDISQGGNVSRGYPHTYTYVKDPIINKYVKDPIINKHVMRGTEPNKHVWKKIKPIGELEAYPLS